jgi:hypothetical protein
VKVERLSEGIYHLKCKTTRELASALVRFQEHYENPNPKFTSGPFTLTEFKTWYRRQKGGRFTYFSDWAGFNVPGHIIDVFRRGVFNPLTKAEKWLIQEIKPAPHQRYCVIGTSDQDGHEALDHELAHAFYALDTQYRRQVNKIIAAAGEHVSGVFRWLVSMKYGHHVLVDETHAYLLCDLDTLRGHDVDISHLHETRERLLVLYRAKRTVELGEEIPWTPRSSVLA